MPTERLTRFPSEEVTRMQGIPLLWQITILVTVLSGVAVVLAMLAHASRRDDEDGQSGSPRPRSR